VTTGAFVGVVTEMLRVAAMDGSEGRRSGWRKRLALSDACADVGAGWAVRVAVIVDPGWAVRAAVIVDAGWAVRVAVIVGAGWAVRVAVIVGAGWAMRVAVIVGASRVPMIFDVEVFGRGRDGRGAAFAVDPTGVTVFVVLLLPDGHSVFDFVDDVTAGREGLGSVACTYAYPYRHLADGEVADAVYACGVFDAETLDGFSDDALALFDGERLEGFVFEVANGKAFVVVADPTFKRCVTPRGGILQLLTQFALVDSFAREAECWHGSSGSAAGDRRDEHNGVAIGEQLRPFAEFGVDCHAQHLRCEGEGVA
jgi:hypothetical protein